MSSYWPTWLVSPWILQSWLLVKKVMYGIQAFFAFMLFIQFSEFSFSTKPEEVQICVKKIDHLYFMSFLTAATIV